MTMRPPVFFFGPLPPPTHGMAMVNAQMVDLIGHHVPIVVGNISPDSLVRGFTYHLRKSSRVLRAMARMPLARIGNCRTLYASPDDGWGGLWTTAILLMARLLGMQIYLHHHSYRYLNQRTVPMQLVTSIAGRSAHHIVLGKGMERRLTDMYSAVHHVSICENSVAMPDSLIAVKNDRKLTIGILANLTREKGALDFLDVAVGSLNARLSTKAVLAGPVPDEEVQQTLDLALAKYPDAVEYRGPVFGAAKEQFFAEIDLFVFPTRYRTEAFPLVLMEALVRGVPVISFDRGCIGQLNGQEGVTLVDSESDFVGPAIEVIRALNLRDRSENRQLVSRAARMRNDENFERLKDMAALIAGDPGSTE